MIYFVGVERERWPRDHDPEVNSIFLGGLVVFHLQGTWLQPGAGSHSIFNHSVRGPQAMPFGWPKLIPIDQKLTWAEIAEKKKKKKSPMSKN